MAKAFVKDAYHSMERKHIQPYLDEFCYRFNRCSYRESLFERLAFALRCVTFTKPFTKSLVTFYIAIFTNTPNNIFC